MSPRAIPRGNPIGLIEVYATEQGGLTFRPVCHCDWVGQTVPGPRTAADAYRIHRTEAHA